jgi:hypothetical protein
VLLIIFAKGFASPGLQQADLGLKSEFPFQTTR